MRSPFSLEHCIFVPQKLADVRLMEYNDTRRIKFPSIQRGSSSDSKALYEESAKGPADSARDGGRDVSGQAYQWHIRHVVYYHTLMFRCILCDPTQVGLDDVIAVQEGKLTGLLDPDLEKDASARCLREALEDESESLNTISATVPSKDERRSLKVIEMREHRAHLVLCVLCQIVQGHHSEFELPAL